MIVSEVFYGVQCDRCSEMYEGNEFSFWMEESTAEEEATESDWHRENGKHYCPNCHEVNGEDEVIIYDEYPKHLKELITFLDSILKVGTREVLEYNDSFVVKFRLFYEPQLKGYQEEYIKCILFEKFIYLEYETTVTHKKHCLIRLEK